MINSTLTSSMTSRRKSVSAWPIFISCVVVCFLSVAETVRLESCTAADIEKHGMTADTVVFKKMPPKWLVASWHLLGVKVVAELTPRPDETPELFRRRAGFGLRRSGADSFEVPGRDTFSEPFKKAMDAAELDYAIAKKLDDLAEECMASQNSGIIREGRHAKAYFHLLADFSSLSSKCLRLELSLRIRNMEKLLGKPISAVPECPVDMPMPEAFTPPENLKQATPYLKDASAKEMTPGIYMQAYPGEHFVISMRWDKVFKNGEYPGVKRDFTLYIPGRENGDYLAYKFNVDLTERPVPTSRAPRMPGAGSYSLEPRFAPPSSDRYSVTPTRLYSRNYPNLHPSFRFGSANFVNPKDGGTEFSVLIKWHRLAEFWPGYVEGRQPSWYIVDSDGNAAEFTWPHGGKALYEKFAMGLCYGDVIQNYGDACSGARNRWEGEDTDFLKLRVIPHIEGNETLFAQITAGQDGSKLKSEVPAVRSKVFSRLGDIAYLGYDILELREKYLEDVLAGREIKATEVKNKKKKLEKLSVPDMSSDDGGNILDLDEPEF